ncbi:hypothetical protein LCGC14_2020180 [marine sediment metagenome]|uniref:ParB/Sulfiredoxin domain-containing protein n=1 Tax=marine sediment metagenome TaxID=412755 RepID=A0A0F9FKB1_9ZZZZ
MEKKKYERDYKMEKFVITSETIKDFAIMDNRRQISEMHSRQIHGAILSGKNPIGILIVNKKKGKIRIIDGNHRIEAVKKFYGYRKTHKDVKIECTLKVYENLDEDQEKQIYADEARRKNESHEDRLNMYKDDIIFWKILQEGARGFPCRVTIYPSAKALKFRNIIDALCVSKRDHSKGYSPIYLRKEELVGFAQDLLWDDFLLMKDFMGMFLGVYGDVSKNNILCSKQAFIPLFDIYAKNRNGFSKEKMADRFGRILGKSDILMQINMGTGRETQIKMRELMVAHMNHGVHKRLFI